MESDEPRVGLRTVAQVTWGKALQYGSTAVYWAALPLTLLLASSRRDLAIGDLLQAAVKLPFA